MTGGPIAYITFTDGGHVARIEDTLVSCDTKENLESSVDESVDRNETSCHEHKCEVKCCKAEE